jgi:hypothetical protein
MNATPPSPARSRLKLLLIVAVFALPVLAALVLNLTGWMPGHSRNFGEVVHPPVSLRDIEFVHAADARTHLHNDQETWTLLVRVPASCDDACWQRVAFLGNVRDSLGRFAPQLDLLLLDAQPPAAQRAALHHFAFASPRCACSRSDSSWLTGMKSAGVLIRMSFRRAIAVNG